jgi:hypothetical protein
MGPLGPLNTNEGLTGDGDAVFDRHRCIPNIDIESFAFKPLNFLYAKVCYENFFFLNR